MKEAEIINLDLPSSTEYLVMARMLTSLVCERMNFSEEKKENIEIAVGEAHINAIKHAYRNGHRGINRINIKYLIYSEKLVIVVKDFGKGFDPYFVQQYIKRVDVEKPERIGLGIFLIKTMMDEVEYDSSVVTGTQVRMTKYK